MGCFTLLFVIVVSLSTILAKNVEHVELVVDSTAVLAETDENYICATIDWWPNDKCNYNNCPWGYSSALNLVRLYESVCLLCVIYILYLYLPILYVHAEVWYVVSNNSETVIR